MKLHAYFSFMAFCLGRLANCAERSESSSPPVSQPKTNDEEEVLHRQSAINHAQETFADWLARQDEADEALGERKTVNSEGYDVTDRVT